MENQILRVQKMLAEFGAGHSTLAFSAAKAGDIEIMELLRDECGAYVFSVNGDGKAPAAYDVAAEGNAVTSLRWLSQNNVLPPLREYIKPSWQRSEDVLTCEIAFLAAAKGAFEALEYIATQVPELHERPLWNHHVILNFAAKPQYGYADPRVVLHADRQDEPLTYSGLLVLCALSASLKGHDPAPVLTRLKTHLEGGGSAGWRDLELALQFDQPESAALLLRAGVKISLPDVLARLKEYAAPTESLKLLVAEFERAPKPLEESCREIKVIEPKNKAVNVRTMAELIATNNGYNDIVSAAVKAARRTESEMTARGMPVASVQEMMRHLVQFLKAVDTRFVGAVLLGDAVYRNDSALVRAVLEFVDPNEYPSDELNQAHPFSDWTRQLAVHSCTNAAMLRLLFEHGADVNLPIRDEDENLLYDLCTPSAAPYPDDMFDAFGRCGGDFARTFRGRSAATLVKGLGSSAHERFMAAKTAASVVSAAGGVGSAGVAIRVENLGGPL
jgi:hypothetical protein